jgi:NAD(P)H-hydrate epimerase
VGPGYGVNDTLKHLLLFLKKEAAQIPVLLDADALTVLSQMSENEKEYLLPSQWILTPHEGEMARLINKSSKEVHEQRSQSLLKAQEKFGCTVLLKGAGTRLTDSSKKIYKINAGNPTLAKAGTGDVLAGMIGGLLAQGYSSIQASLLGAFWHADMSDWYLKTKGPEFSLRASEISDLLPQYWKESF